ncbi:MAG: DMT family transporter [Bilophila wadsworthia]
MKTGAVSSQWYAFATVVLWSSAFVFTKVALLSFSSTALGFLRCAIASVVLYAVLRCKGVRMLSWRELPRFTLSGALGFSIYLFIFNKGSETLTAATGCILIATAPIITALMASVVFRERLTRLAWIALWLAFLGVLVLMLWNGSVSINAGVFWMLGAALAIVQRSSGSMQTVASPRYRLPVFYGNGDAGGLLSELYARSSRPLP